MSEKFFKVKSGITTANIVFNNKTVNSNLQVSYLQSNVLSFSGTSGQLFSIADTMTGTIFAVNDISGVPSIEVYDTGDVRLAETFGNVLIGSATNPSNVKLYVNGSAAITGNLVVGAISASNSYGSPGQVLTSNSSGVYWSTVAASSGLGASSYVVRAVKNGSTQTVTNGADAVVTMVDDFDPQGWWTPNKFQPTIAGYYTISAQLWWGAGSINNNQTNLQLRKNGSAQLAIAQTPVNNSTVGEFLSISTIAYFNGTTDYVEVTAYTANPTSQDINGSANGTWFAAALLAAGWNESSINNVQSNVTTLTASVNTIKANVDSVQSNVSTLTTSVNTIRANVDSVAGNVTTLTTGVNTIRANVNSVQGNLTSYISTANLHTATTTGNVTTNNIQIGGLKATSAEFTGSITIAGNLFVTANSTFLVSANNLSLEDNMIYLNANNKVANPDLGIAGNYNDGTYRHAGVFRDATDGIWKFFDSYLPEPDASPYIDISNTSFNLSSISANSIILTRGVSTGGTYGTAGQVLLSDGTNSRWTTIANAHLVQSNVNTVQSNVTTLTSGVNGIQANINSVQGNVSTLTTSVNTIKANVDSVQSNVSTNTTRINTVQGNVTTLTSGVNGIQANINSVQGNVSTVATAINTVQSNVTSLTTSVNTIKANVDSVASNVTSILTGTTSFTGSKTFAGPVVFSNTISANASVGSAGQVLTSNGSGVYWSTPSSGGGITTGKAIAMAIVFGG
jgi:archaellum component FlaC